jgi:FtsP/CotA-like multicopper oxidase with cupredoxin domain
VIAADGRPVEPVVIDEFRMAVAETYDVIVEPKEDRAWPLWVETLDRRANVLATLGSNPDMRAEAPAPRPMQVLLLGEMGHAMAPVQAGDDESRGAPDTMTAELNDAAARQPAGTCTPEHAAMGHCTMPVDAPKPAPACTPEHAAMGHCTPKVAPAPQPGSPRAGTAVALDKRPDGGTLFPRVDYGYGMDPMAGMDHGKMNHAAELGREGDTDGSGRVFGWATGAPYGARVLSIRDLVAAAPAKDDRAPTREILIRITGNMERYIWSLNGKPFGEAPPVTVGYGERVRITFVNETMMAHPMHLHGMFFEVENGGPADRLPEKNVIAVAPGRTQSILLTADEPGEWPLHCHLLYHMDSGMMQKLVVAKVDAPPASHAHSAH